MRPEWSTVALQAVNVLVLVWLLGRFFWRPLAAMIEQRRAAIARDLDAAAAERAAAVQAREQAQAEDTRLQAERATRLAAVQAEADALRAAEAERMREQAAALRAAAAAEAARQAEAGEARQRALAEALAVDIAGRLAARLDGPAVRDAFRAWLLSALEALEPAQHEALRRQGVELVSAAALDADERARCAEGLARVLGGAPAVQWRVDPALIAGLELRAPGLRVSNSWRADLDAMRRSLEGGEHD